MSNFFRFGMTRGKWVSDPPAESSRRPLMDRDIWILGGKSRWRLRHAREMPATFGWQIRGFVTFPGA